MNPQEQNIDMNSVLGNDTEHTPDTAPVDNNVPQNVEPAYNPLSDPGRVEYWQSRADKIAMENQELLKYKEMASFVASEPELMDQVQKRAEARYNPAATAIPQPPNQPQDYNEYDAYNDEYSESYKYRLAYDKFNREWSGYVAKKLQADEVNRMNREKAQYQENMQRQRIGQMATALKSQYAFNDNEVVDYIRTMSDPSTLSQQNLVRYYRFLKSNQPSSGYNATPSAPIGGGGAQRSAGPQSESQSFANFLKSK